MSKVVDAKRKHLAVLPIQDGGITAEFYVDANGNIIHNGSDWGWKYKPNDSIFAIQSGFVISKFYNAIDIGHAVVIRTTYSDGTHRDHGYIHLKEAAVVNKGDYVEAGQKIGVRGGSPYIKGKPKYGEHLHLYTTRPHKRPYSWSNMKKEVIDPFTELIFHKMPGRTYHLSTKDGHNFGKTAPIWKEEKKSVIPEPVKRDESRNQIEIKSDTRNLREGPGLSAKKYSQYCKRGIYNVNKKAVADNYIWANIADGYWVAVKETDGNYPAVDYKILYQNLKDDLTIYLTQKDELIKQRDKAYEEIEDIKSTIKIYTTQKEVLIDRLEKALSEIKGV